MIGYGGDMQSINLCFRRENTERHDRTGDLRDFRRMRQKGYAIKCKQAVCCESWVAAGRLVDDILGHYKLVTGSLVVPPLVR